MNNPSTLAQLADIYPPAPPGDWTMPLLAGAALFIIAVVATIAVYLQRRRRRSTTAVPASAANDAVQQLADVQRLWQSGSLPARETAYRLATILRLGLDLAQLTPQCPTSLQNDAANWRRVISALEGARYRKGAGETSIDHHYFELITHWLKTHENAGAR